MILSVPVPVVSVASLGRLSWVSQLNLVTAATFTLDPTRAYFGACLLPVGAMVLLGLAGWRNATRR